MEQVLHNKRLVVGVCGGIAAFKAVALVSQLQKAGALVDVIMTEHASEFVSALSFSSLSHRPVYADLWEPTGQAAARHIELGREADLLVIVPATANTIAKLAHGMADNMLGAVALATTAPLLVAPAMEQAMYRHPATQANLATLRSRGAMIVEPEVGTLASGEVGAGRLPEPETLVQAIRQALGRAGPLAGRRVVVTAGGTQEPIDPVRFIGNRSSGLMGYALAEEARDRGARVTLISGPVGLAPPYGVEMVRVQTALEMRAAVLAALGLRAPGSEPAAAGAGPGDSAEALVMAAAVADYRVEHPAAEKMKKEPIFWRMWTKRSGKAQAVGWCAWASLRRRPILRHMRAPSWHPRDWICWWQTMSAGRTVALARPRTRSGCCIAAGRWKTWRCCPRLMWPG